MFSKHQLKCWLRLYIHYTCLTLVTFSLCLIYISPIFWFGLWHCEVSRKHNESLQCQAAIWSIDLSHQPNELLGNSHAILQSDYLQQQQEKKRKLMRSIGLDIKISSFPQLVIYHPAYSNSRILFVVAVIDVFARILCIYQRHYLSNGCLDVLFYP